MESNVIRSGKYNWPKAINLDLGPFIFISYSHRNSVLACHDFSLLSTYEVPFWYDDGMVPGQDWKEKAYCAMYHPNCKGVVFYISKSSVSSPAIYEELKMASDLMLKRDGFSVFSVNIGGKSVAQMIKDGLIPPDYGGLYQKMFPPDTIYINRKMRVASTDHIYYLLEYFNERKMLKKKYSSLLERNPFILSSYKDAYIITGLRGDAEEIIIPESVGGKQIIAIGPNAFAFNTIIKKIYFKGDIREIFDNAFEGCKNLRVIVFNDSLLSIGNNVFKGCSKLNRLKFPSKLRFIGDYAFYQCKNLVSVDCNGAELTIGYACFSQCISLCEIKSVENLVSIDGYAFGGCVFESFTIYDKVEELGVDCFVNNPCLKHIYFYAPYLPQKTAHSIVALCPQFKCIIVPVGTSDSEFMRFEEREKVKRKVKNVTSFSNDGNGFKWESINGADEYYLTIDEQNYVTKEAYLEYKFLKKKYQVTIISHNNSPQVEDAVSSFTYNIKLPLIDNGILLGGSFDEGVLPLNNNIIQIGERAFAENLDVRELHFNGDLIEKSAFESALNLTTVSFMRPLSLRESAFRNCVKLRSVDFQQVKEMENFCFENCGMLESIILREGLCRIPEKAFRRCIRVKEIVFPHSLQTIGKEAFRGCMGLINLNLPDGLKTIEEGALTYLTIKKIVLPHSLEMFGINNLQNCSYLEEISIDDNQLYSVENGYLVYKKTMLLRYPPAREKSDVVISDNILTIARDAFRDSIYLKTIVVNNIEIIESGAFYGCSSLQSVILSGNIKRIGRGAFLHCPNLRNIVIKSSTKVEIEQNAIEDSVKVDLNNIGE